MCRMRETNAPLIPLNRVPKRNVQMRERNAGERKYARKVDSSFFFSLAYIVCSCYFDWCHLCLAVVSFTWLGTRPFGWSIDTDAPGTCLTLQGGRGRGNHRSAKSRSAIRERSIFEPAVATIQILIFGNDALVLRLLWSRKMTIIRASSSFLSSSFLPGQWPGT